MCPIVCFRDNNNNEMTSNSANVNTHSMAITRLHALCNERRWMRPIFVVGETRRQQQQQSGAIVVVVSYTARVCVNNAWYDTVDETATKSTARVAAAIEALRVLDRVVG